MSRPREFDEDVVLDAVMQRFWAHGYESTSVKDLVEKTGVSSASLYNAYGNKRALFGVALEYYEKKLFGERLARYERLAPREGIEAFFDDILRRSIHDPEHKGCMVVNAAMELAAHDREVGEAVANMFRRLEIFFRTCVERGQEEGTITRSKPAGAMAQHLLGVLMGIRVLARVRPERPLLEGGDRGGARLARSAVKAGAADRHAAGRGRHSETGTAGRVARG